MEQVSLYIGRAGTGKTRACFELIQRIRQEHPGEPIILLVPDSATYYTERSLAEFSKEKGFTTVRVVGFGRLAYQVFQSIGKSRKESISELGQKLLLRLILKESPHDLELFRQVAKQPHFADVVQGMINECTAFAVTAVDLKEAAQSMNNMVLQRKLIELSRLIELYEERLERIGGEQIHPMEELLEALGESPILKNSHLIVDGFHWFTPIQMKLIQALIDCSKEAVMTITLPAQEKERHEQQKEGALFHRTWELYDLMRTIYPNAQVVEFNESVRYQNEVLQSLEKGFFTRPMKKYEGEVGIHVTAAYNREREVDAVCRQIWNYIGETSPILECANTGTSTSDKGNGNRPVLGQMSSHIDTSNEVHTGTITAKKRWKDISIILRDEEAYGDFLEKQLEKYEIPYFSDRRNPMKTHPLSEFLNSLLEVVQQFFHHDALFRLLKTDLFPISRKAVDELENYCLEHGIRGGHWLLPRWEFEAQQLRYHMGGQDQHRGDNEEVHIDENIASELQKSSAWSTEREMEIHETKTAIMAYLKPLYTMAKDDHTGREWVEYLFQIMLDLEIPRTLHGWAEEARDRGDVIEAAAHEQMYKQVINLFDDIIGLAEQDILDLDMFRLILEEGLGEVTYSLVPPSLDHVTITTVERGYTRESKVVFLLGLNDGVFPRRIGEEGMLNDGDRKALKEVGVVLAEGALTKSFNENFLLYLGATRAREQLFLSYAGADEEGNTMEPSLVVQRLRQLGYIRTIEEAPMSIQEGVEKVYLWRPKQSLGLLASRVGLAYKGHFVAPIWWSLYNWGLRDGRYREAVYYATRGISDSNKVAPIRPDIVRGLLFKQDTMTGSVTRFERYQACPYQFYAQYGLHLEPRKVKSFGSPEIGTFLHESLRYMGNHLLQEGKQWRDLAPQEQDQLRKESLEYVKKRLNYDNGDAFQSILMGRLESTLERSVKGLVDWSKKSSFTMKLLEQSFGRYDGTSWKPVYIPLGTSGGEAIRLQGQIDRIDILSSEEAQYVAVIDYKTGKAGISASEIFYGLKLQLMTYVMALEASMEGKAVYPAAAMYTYVADEKISERRVLNYKLAQIVKEEDGRLENSGYFTDKDVLQELDTTRAYGMDSTYVPIRLKKDGGINHYDVYKVKTEEDFRVLIDYTKRMMTRIGQSIMEGRFPIRPYRTTISTPCRYCQYKALCRFEGTRNGYRDLPKLAEDEAMECMNMEKGGTLYEMD